MCSLGEASSGPTVTAWWEALAAYTSVRSPYSAPAFPGLRPLFLPSLYFIFHLFMDFYRIMFFESCHIEPKQVLDPLSWLAALRIPKNT